MTAPRGPDRMPMPSDGQLSDEQRAAVEEVRGGPRGEMLACFIPFLRAPGLLGPLQEVGAYLRYRSSLRDDLRELVILVVSQHWSQGFEWAIHQPIARAAGLLESVIDDVAHGRRPGGAEALVGVLWDLVTEIQTTHEVADATYNAAAELLDETQLAEVFALVGYYTTLALTMNAVRTPLPAGPRLPNR